MPNQVKIRETTVHYNNDYINKSEMLQIYEQCYTVYTRTEHINQPLQVVIVPFAFAQSLSYNKIRWSALKLC